MTAKLKSKKAIVTGASRGIGRAIAVRLGGEGCTVMLAGRAMEHLEKTADLVRQAGGGADAAVVELTSEDSIGRFVAESREKLGGLDILVNNAGITHSASLEETTTEAWDAVMAVNSRGPFLLCREALPMLKQRTRSYIVNIASVVAVKGYPQQSAYTASKHALRGMSMSLAEELRGTGVRVHLLCPGGVDTEMVSRVRPDIAKDELIDPEEIAELVLYLVTHEGNAVVDELHIRRSASSPWFIS